MPCLAFIHWLGPSAQLGRVSSPPVSVCLCVADGDAVGRLEALRQTRRERNTRSVQANSPGYQVVGAFAATYIPLVPLVSFLMDL